MGVIDAINQACTKASYCLDQPAEVDTVRKLLVSLNIKPHADTYEMIAQLNMYIARTCLAELERMPPRTLDQPYYIHDNGGRPFKVFVSPDNVVRVFRQDSSQAYESSPFQTFHAQRVFIGKSPVNRMTAFSGGYGPDNDGNSILLQLADRYVYIGLEIYSFTITTMITDYVSPVGNNDVPYPYATCEDGSYVLLGEGVQIALRDPLEAEKDPYSVYYHSTDPQSWNEIPGFQRLELIQKRL